MKIIKKGVDPKDVEIEKTCLNCLTVFSFTLAELKGDSNGSYINCPLCNGIIYHKYTNSIGSFSWMDR